MSDDDLLEFVSEFRDGLLDGGSSYMACFAVCWPLQGLLAAHGIETTLTEGSVEIADNWHCNHFWLRLKDGRVLDPTADQFDWLDVPPVYLGDPLDIHRREAA